jgi:hypothetical protein
MSISLEALEAEVLKLPSGPRAHLLDRLIASLEIDTDNRDAWGLEAERRDAEVNGGKVSTVPSGELLERLHTELR